MANVATRASTEPTLGAGWLRVTRGLRRSGAVAQACHERRLTRRAERPSVARVSADLRRRLGEAGERAAEAHLRRLGFELLERNYRTRWGELDLVGFDGTTIVFCEVKARRAGSGRPWDALGPAKRNQVRRIAARWLSERTERPRAAELRFDAIGVVVDARDRVVALEHLEGAF
jgi:putative endonuclease